MKIDLHLSSEEDMEQFKTLFLRHVGVEHIVFDIYANFLFVRIQIEGYNNSQSVKIGMFSRVQDGKTTSISQFHPLADEGFRYTDEVQRIWGTDPKEVWATLFHREEDAEIVFANIMQLLDLVKSVG